MRLIATIGGLLLSAIAAAAPGTLTFTRPATRADGSPLSASEISSYQVICTYTPTGGVAAPCVNPTPSSFPGSATGGALTFTVTQDGQACFSLSTVDTGARVSVPSSPLACKQVTISPPNPATGVTVAQVSGESVTVVFLIKPDTLKRSSIVAGVIDVGDPCYGARLFPYKTQNYFRVARADVRFAVGVAPSDYIAAPCASS